jgi:hypothetical protein
VVTAQFPNTTGEHMVQCDFLLPIPLWAQKMSRMPTMLPDPMLEFHGVAAFKELR